MLVLLIYVMSRPVKCNILHMTRLQCFNLPSCKYSQSVGLQNIQDTLEVGTVLLHKIEYTLT